MINLLAQLLIKDYKNTDLPEVRRAYGVLSGTVGIFLNLVLSAGKFAAGFFTHSVSITADAVNNLSDAASSIMTLIGFRLAGKKADRDHPFGHGRSEYIAGLFVSISILLMGADLARSSVVRILHPEKIIYSNITIAILAVSIAVKLYMFLYNRAVGKKISSAAMTATATDSLSDSVATTVVLLSMGVSHFFHVNIDGYAGLHYTDRTGRNDLQEARVAITRRGQVAFYVRCGSPITPHTDPSWMLLLIDADQDSQTGWYGYDLLVNQEVRDAHTTVVKRYEGGQWTTLGTVPLAVSGCELELSLPAQWLGIQGREASFDFKWADNPGELLDPISLCTHGDTAPNRRFNYRFVWKK